jgi:RimJ/RimL family protein N-acetyltransferase
MTERHPERPADIETLRLRLVVLLPHEIRSLIARDTERASQQAGVTFPPGWPEEHEAREGLPWHLRHFEANERHRAWRIRVVAERATGTVIGSVNLKGPPDLAGDVEIGWGITEAHRRRGYAFEAARGVIEWVARQPGARSLSATIADDNVASQQLAVKLGLVRTSEVRRQKPLWSRLVAAHALTDYEFVSPADEAGWRSYHDIRRHVLFEARGSSGVYDETHPHDRAPGNHPKLLLFRSEPVGVIRIDIAAENAIFRRVAIRADMQRRGHGSVLLWLAERFAVEHGCRQLTSFVALDAVGFYQKCGFALDAAPVLVDDHRAVLMRKHLT